LGELTAEVAAVVADYLGLHPDIGEQIHKGIEHSSGR